MTVRVRLSLRLAVAVTLVVVALTSGGAGAAGGPSGKIAFASDRGGSFDIYAMGSDGSNVANLTSVAGADTEPAWSADGSKLAFVSDRDGNAEIYVMNADGSGQVDVTNNPAPDTSPAWSPDGSKLAFVTTRDGNAEIYASGVNGAGPARLTNSVGTDEEPSWSPDDLKIAFVSDRDGNQELYAMNADGGGQTRLSNDTFPERSPVWAPDGSRIAYTADDGNEEIYVVDAAGGAPTRLTTDPADDRSPSWSTSLANTVPPSAPSGAAVDGSILTAATGTWVGVTPITFAFEWKRCVPAAATCVSIAGAASKQYTLTSADVGAAIRVLVTASNINGNASALSSATAVVTATAPVNTVPPAVSGTAGVGRTLTATTGTWSGTTPVQFTFQWERCPSSGGTCAPITGATAASYVVVATDAGSAIRVVVTATNVVGSTSATSPSVTVGAAGSPTNTTLPTIAGPAVVGSMLTATPGVWTGTTPLTYAYAWQRCNGVGASCLTIPAATTASYRLGSADVGSTLRVQVTASNASGSSLAASDPTAIVAANTAPGRPQNATVPFITGVPTTGSLLTAHPGSWTGSAPITYGFAWQRCSSAEACDAIAGAEASTYRPTQSDVGFQVRVEVTASNSAGSATAASAPTEVVKGESSTAGLINTRAPKITGPARVGSKLTAKPGTWTGAALIRYTYRWQRCLVKTKTCGPIAAASSKKYRVRRADLGARLRVQVTGSTDSGSATAVSATTAVVTRKRVAPGPAARGKSKRAPRQPAPRRPVQKPPPTRGVGRLGTNGRDVLIGTAGPDVMSGRGGDDVVYGGPGNDRITGGAGHDRLFGGADDDRIFANDGDRDLVDCGPGRDQVDADGLDILSSCELVRKHATLATRHLAVTSACRALARPLCAVFGTRPPAPAGAGWSRKRRL